MRACVRACVRACGGNDALDEASRVEKSNTFSLEGDSLWGAVVHRQVAPIRWRGTMNNIVKAHGV